MKHVMTRASIARSLSALLAVASVAASAQTPGTPDQSFGIGGRLTLDHHGGSDTVYAVKPLKDGRFLAAGVVYGPNAQGLGGSGNLSVSRFLSDGRIDPTFAGDGTYELDIEGGQDEARAIALLPDRSIILAGSLVKNAYSDFSVVKLTRDGTPDTTFGQNNASGGRTGWNRMDIGGSGIHDDPVGVAVQRSGKIVVVGRTAVTVGSQRYTRAAVARFTADGQPDLTFGGNGTGFVILPAIAADQSDQPSGIALDKRDRLLADDSITIVGSTHGLNQAFVARFTADGLIDTTFGANAAGGGRTGRATFTASNPGGVHEGVSTISSARLVDNGRIALLGLGRDRGMVFMRLHGDGALDTSFGTNGRTLMKFSGSSTEDIPFSLAVQANGRLVGAGFAINTVTGVSREDFFMARLNANGQPDNSFGDGQGRAVVQVAVDRDRAQSVHIEPSGKVLVGGFALRPNTAQTDYALVRLHGDPDRIFFHDFELPHD